MSIHHKSVSAPIQLSKRLKLQRQHYFVAAISLLAVSFPIANAQGVPDVMNALGVPYSPAVEHELQQSDQRQIYGEESEEPKIPLWQYLTSPHSVKEELPKEEKHQGPLPSAFTDGPVGEIDESLISPETEKSNVTGTPASGVFSQQNNNNSNVSSLDSENESTENNSLNLTRSLLLSPAPSDDEFSLFNDQKVQQADQETVNPPTQANQFSNSSKDTNPKRGIRINGYMPAEKSQAVIFIDTKGKVTSPSLGFKEINPFSNDLAAALSNPESEVAVNDLGNNTPPVKPAFGFVNSKGQWVIEPKYLMVGDFKHVYNTPSSVVYARAKWLNIDDEPKWGFIDQTGQMMISNRYNWVSDFSEGFAITSLPITDDLGKPNGEQYGYINTVGTLVIQPQFEEADPFREGVAKVWDGKLNAHGWPNYRFITPDGTTKLESPYDWVSGFQNGFARVGNLGDAQDENTKNTTPQKFGYMNLTGQLSIPIQYEAAWPFARLINNKLLALVKTQGKYAYITETGNYAFKQQFDWADEFYENLAAVKINGKYGFINPFGKLAIKPQFDWIGHFSEGLAPVAQKTPEGLRYGYINTSGKIIIPLQYHWATQFSNGIAQVR